MAAAWFEVALDTATGCLQESLAEEIADLNGQMSPDQRSEAQQLAREWRIKHPEMDDECRPELPVPAPTVSEDSNWIEGHPEVYYLVESSPPVVSTQANGVPEPAGQNKEQIPVSDGHASEASNWSGWGSYAWLGAGVVVLVGFLGGEGVSDVKSVPACLKIQIRPHWNFSLELYPQ